MDAYIIHIYIYIYLYNPWNEREKEKERERRRVVSVRGNPDPALSFFISKLHVHIQAPFAWLSSVFGGNQVHPTRGWLVAWFVRSLVRPLVPTGFHGLSVCLCLLVSAPNTHTHTFCCLKMHSRLPHFGLFFRATHRKSRRHEAPHDRPFRRILQLRLEGVLLLLRIIMLYRWRMEQPPPSPLPG
jgi:hypothetical protein